MVPHTHAGKVMIEVGLIVIGISISKAELIKWNNVAAGKFGIIANDISVKVYIAIYTFGNK